MDAVTRPADRRVLWAIASTGFVSSLQFTLMVPALPSFPELLNVSVSDASWIVTITLLTGTVVTPILARLADMRGRKRMLLIAMITLGVGSLIAAIWSSHFWLVMLGRAMQGFGTTIVPIGVSLLRSILPRDRAVIGIAMLSGTVGIGSGFGLPLAGVLLASGGLPFTFLFSALGAAITATLVWRWVPEQHNRANGSFDLVGASVLAVGLTAILLIVSKVGEWGITSPATIAAALVCGVAIALFIPLQLRSSSPVIDLRLATRPAMVIANAVGFLTSFAMFANFLLTMQEARAPESTAIGLGLAEISAGLVLVPFAVAMVLGAPATAALMRRFGTRAVLLVGSLVMAISFGFRFFVHGSLVALLIGTLLAGVGTALVFGTLPTLVLDVVPIAQASSASGLNSLMRSVSGAVASAAFAFLLTLYGIVLLPDYLTETGLMIGLGTTSLFCLLSTVLTWFLPRRQQSA
ncbi:MFS transporter [Microbacterium sp. NC79]|uniref:MFS transporter n=1 Tax=Microbacterium sp. NC79 TaxID=2851009 RepID=UPI001C2BE8C0|nr:MFS transporter [Microbacterium sp. NC79]